MPGSDQELVKLALEGDEDAQRELFVRHTPAVSRAAVAIAKHRGDADDLVQETFVRAFSNLADFDGRSRFTTWIIRIVLNRAATLLEARERERHRMLAHHEVEREAPDPDERVFWSQVRPHLRNGLELLAPKERIAFVCRHHLEMPVREISALLGCDDTATRNSIFRAVRKLRAHLEPLVRPNHESEPSDRRAVD